MSELTQLIKDLSPQISQDIQGRIKLLEYSPNVIEGIEDGSYSVYEFEGFSCVNKPYEFQISFVSDLAINIENISDTNVELKLIDKNNPLVSKSIFGKIFKVEESSVVAKKYMYKIHVVSPIYYMGLNSSCEIFLDQRVPDIIQEIVNRYASLLNVKLDMRIDLNNAPIKEYTTRYNQSCLEFITMLCEQEGYSMIMDYSSCEVFTITLCELNEQVKVYDNSFVASFNQSKEFSISHFLEDFYDKDKPSLEMQTLKGASIQSETLQDNTLTSQLRNDLKYYTLKDNVSELKESLYNDLERYTKNDSQMGFVNSFNIFGKSAEFKMSDSILMTLHDEKANKQAKVITTTVKYYGKFENALDEFISEADTKSLQFFTKFNSIPYDVPFRPLKKIKKPKIEGTLTAIVSNGNSNPSEYSNEIDVDNEGRVRVIFHFEENSTTSTYLRMSNIYSGDNYGTQFIPRVNTEVIIAFINGDPDQPVIIGTVHNGENKLPYSLPKSKSKSFIRTSSSPAYPDKLGYNEIAFEDKKDEEELSLRAQRDYKLYAQNSSYTNIDNNSYKTVTNDEEKTVKYDYKETVGNTSTRTIKANDIKTVEKEEVHTIQEDKRVEVSKDFTTIVKRDKKTYVEKDLVDSIKNILHTYIEGDVTDKYLEDFFIQVGKEMGVDIEGSFHLDTTSVKEQASKIAEVDAPSGISLKCGSNILTIDSSGIHFKTLNYNDNTGNNGVSGSVVSPITLEKPKYEDLRVVEVTTSLEKQESIFDEIIYTAKVEKFENGVWNEYYDLTNSEFDRLSWNITKNDYENDSSILDEVPTTDTVKKEKLQITVTPNLDKPYSIIHATAQIDGTLKKASNKTELIVPEKLDIVEILFDPKNRTIILLPQEANELFEVEDAYVSSSLDKIKELREKNTSPTQEQLIKAKEHTQKALKDLGVQTLDGSNFTELRRLKGKKFTYVRSDKMENHFRRYSLDVDDKKRELQAKAKLNSLDEIMTNDRLDLEKLQEAFKSKLGGQKVEFFNYEPLNNTKALQQFTDWMNAFADGVEWKSKNVKDEKRVWDASSDAQWMRFAAGASISSSPTVDQIFKGQLVFNGEAEASYSLFQAEAKANGFIPNASGLNILLKDGSINLGYIRAMVSSSLSGFVGASAMLSTNVNFKVSPNDELLVLADSSNDPDEASAKADLFSGAKGEAKVDGEMQWKNPEEKKDFVELAKVGYGISGKVGGGLEGEFQLKFEDGRFIFRAKAGVVLGLGAGGEVAFAVDYNNIAFLAHFVYHTLMKHDYTFLDFIHDDAFKALSEYLVQKIRAKVNKDIEEAMQMAEKAKEFSHRLNDEWNELFVEYEEAKALANSINSSSQDEYRYLTPEARGRLIAILAQTSSEKEKLLDKREEEERAIIKLFKYVQCKAEANQVFKSVSLDGSRVSKEQGMKTVNILLDGAEQLIANLWYNNLDETAPRKDEAVVALSLPDFPVNLTRTV